jgi:hypothetical protein
MVALHAAMARLYHRVAVAVARRSAALIIGIYVAQSLVDRQERFRALEAGRLIRTRTRPARSAMNAAEGQFGDA